MPTTQTADPTVAVLTNALDTPKRTIYAALSELCGVRVVENGIRKECLIA
jgi:hypothetical protein